MKQRVYLSKEGEFMNIKKIAIIVLVLLCIGAAFLPAYTVMDGGEYVARVWTFFDFHPLGAVVVAIPFTLLALYFSKISVKYKRIMLVVSVPLSAMFLNIASFYTREWMRCNLDGYMKLGFGTSVFGIALGCLIVTMLVFLNAEE